MGFDAGTSPPRGRFPASQGWRPGDPAVSSANVQPSSMLATACHKQRKLEQQHWHCFSSHIKTCLLVTGFSQRSYLIKGLSLLHCLSTPNLIGSILHGCTACVCCCKLFDVHDAHGKYLVVQRGQFTSRSQEHDQNREPAMYLPLIPSQTACKHSVFFRMHHSISSIANSSPSLLPHGSLQVMVTICDMFYLMW